MCALLDDKVEDLDTIHDLARKRGAIGRDDRTIVTARLARRNDLARLDRARGVAGTSGDIEPPGCGVGAVRRPRLGWRALGCAMTFLAGLRHSRSACERAASKREPRYCDGFASGDFHSWLPK